MRTRSVRVVLALALPLLLVACGGGGGDGDNPDDPQFAGAYAFDELAFDDLRDVARGRDVPTTVYLPAGNGPSEIVVLSHGAAATRTSYRYLAEHLASHGYVVLVPAHVGSDLGAVLFLRDDQGITLGEATLRVTEDPLELEARGRDVTFLLDTATTWHASHAQLQGRLDLDQVGVIGHSYGAYTALVAGGALAGLPGGLTSLADARVDAFVALSPQGTGGTGQFELTSFDAIARPALLMTGTLDVGFQGQPASWRREPYDRMPAGDKFFASLTDAEHLHFSQGLGGQASQQTHRIVTALATAFFNVYVRQDPAYATYLDTTYANALTGSVITAVAWSAK